jgi:NhaA family Na+:H+ antiporter
VAAATGPTRFGRPLREFLATEAAGGTVLLLAAFAALVWANSPWSAAYESFFATEIVIGVGRWSIEMHLEEWINDAAMTLFFLVVGLEIKRELVHGELRDIKAAAVPLIGAAGGMLVPALIYTAFNAGHPGANGWGVPVATDIAFAVGVLAILGRRAPAGLKLLLLTLAVADDVGGIVVIAVAYATDLQLEYLAVAALALGATVYARKIKLPWLVLPLAVIAWLATRASGIHATIAGVVLAMLTPAHPENPGDVTREWADELDREPTVDELKQLWYLAGSALSPVERIEHRLHPWTSFLIAPLFALANVGVDLGDVSFDAPGATRIALGAGVGLVVGKLLGVTTAMFLAVKTGVGRLPGDVRWPHIVGGGFVAGIGFTVSLFIGGIAFDDQAMRDVATISVLIGSVVAAILASIWLSLVSRTSPGDEEPAALADESVPAPAGDRSLVLE